MSIPVNDLTKHRTCSTCARRLSIVCGIVVLCLFLLPRLIFAQSVLEDENYYYRAGVGFPFEKYSSTLASEIEEIKREGGDRSMIAALDVGLYWPVFSRRHLLGVAVTGFFDAYSGDGWSSTVNYAQIGPSFQFFLMPGIGDGPYLRLDPGMAMQWSDTQVSTSEGTLRFQSAQNTGFGLLAGGGYAFPVSSGTRLTIDLAYTWRNTGSYRATTVQVGAGVLW